MDRRTEDTLLALGAGQPAGVPDATLAEIIEEIAHVRPEAVAVVHGSTELTYGELDDAATGLARRLCAAGAGPEIAIGVCVSRTTELVTALLAVLKSGAYYVPLDPALPTGRLSLMLTDAAPIACIVDTATEHRLPQGPWQNFAVTSILDDFPIVRAKPDNLAYVIYTSGSTGRPKGVCIEHRSVVDLVVNSAAAYRAGPDDRMLAYASIGFDISVAEIFTALAVGATLVMADEEDRLCPDRLLNLLTKHRVTIAEVPPTLLGLLEPDELPDLRLMIVGGEAPPARHIARWVAAGPRVINAYGPTETTVTATLLECSAEPLVSVPIGRPMANHRAYVLDEAGALVEPGAEGELWISGPGVARGYLGLPELTEQRFMADHFHPEARMYRTGDRVRWNPDGTLQFLGRVDGQLNLRGFRIEPGEVEARLRAHPNVRAAAVCTREIAGDTQLIGYLVTTGHAPSTDDLTAWCSHELPPAFVPSTYLVLDELPLDPNGKVDRAALPTPAIAAGSRCEPPRTDTEARLLAIWRELLPGAGIGVTDDFFQLGGHSLVAMRMLARIRREFGVAVPMQSVYRARTIAALAIEIVATGPAAPSTTGTGGSDALSYAQRQLWFVDRLTPDLPTYNVPVGLRLRGALDSDRLAGALGAVVARHETLRCSFALVDDQPVTIVAAPAPVRLPVDDLRQVPRVDREQALHELAGADASAPFTLSEAPLWRARLVRLGDDEWAFIFVAHHAIADGWSLSVLFDEVGQHYAGGDLPPLTVQYRDFAAAQCGQDLGAGLEFWRTTLAQAPAALDLPADRGRPMVQTHTPGRVTVPLSATAAEHIRQLAAEHRVTPFVAMLALFQVLLGRLAGVADLVVACPVAGRPEPELEALIGLFVNTVPVRGDLSGNPTFAELLARTHTASLAAFSHADVPFSQVVEAVRPPRDLRRSPIAQVAFNLLNYPPERLRLPGITAEDLSIEPPGSLLDLTLYVHESGPQPRLEVVYNRDLFDRSRIVALLNQYTHLIEQADGPRRIGSLSLATGRALPDPTQPLSDVTGPTVVDRFRHQAAQSPDAPAVEGWDEKLSYGQLDAESDAVAAHLAANGVARGMLVAVPAVRAARLAVVLLGIFKAGAVACLLDRAHPAPRLVGMLRRVAPSAWLAVDDAPLPGALTAYLRGAGLACQATALDLPDASTTPDGPALDDPAHVLFTSGSTGTPNAVIAAHRPLAHFVDWYTETFRIGPADRFAVASGVAHDPLLRDLIVPLCVGATACVPAPDVHRQPDELARWMRGERVTVTHVTPQLARLLASTGETLPELRLLATGGDVLRQADVPALTALAPMAELVAFYGATETPQAVGWQSVRHGGSARTQVPLGTGIADTQLLVQGAYGGPAGVGELGEIVVRGPHLALGYLGDPQRTAARFIARAGDPRRGYRTGDLGRYLPDGRVEFAGRRDSQVKVRGYRVELGEVTAVLERHPQVRQALVVAMDGPDDDTRLVAYVVPEDGARPLADLNRHLNALLPPFAIPAAVVPVGRIPLGPNGKVDLGALPQSQVRASAFMAPRSRAEQAVAQVWREVLGTGPVGLNDNFFDLGGSSLHLVKVQRRLTAELQIPLTIIDLFRYPTVRGLAALLSAPTSDETTSTEPGASAARVTRRTEMRRAGRARRQA